MVRVANGCYMQLLTYIFWLVELMSKWEETGFSGYPSVICRAILYHVDQVKQTMELVLGYLH
jgi:hypothetical protein